MRHLITPDPPGDGGHPSDADPHEATDDGCPVVPDPAPRADDGGRDNLGVWDTFDDDGRPGTPPAAGAAEELWRSDARTRRRARGHPDEPGRPAGPSRDPARVG